MSENGSNPVSFPEIDQEEEMYQDFTMDGDGDADADEGTDNAPETEANTEQTEMETDETATEAQKEPEPTPEVVEAPKEAPKAVSEPKKDEKKPKRKFIPMDNEEDEENPVGELFEVIHKMEEEGAKVNAQIKNFNKKDPSMDIYKEDGTPKDDVVNLDEKKKSNANPNKIYKNWKEVSTQIGYMNQHLMALHEEVKRIMIMKIVIEQQFETTEARLKEYDQTNARIDGILSRIEEDRRFSDLSTVDYDEIERRIMDRVGVSESPTQANKKSKPKKKKSSFGFYTIIGILFIVGLLIGGYWFKTQILGDLKPIKAKPMEVKISNGTKINCDGIEEPITIKSQILKGSMTGERFSFVTNILEKDRICTIKKSYIVQILNN